MMNKETSHEPEIPKIERVRSACVWPVREPR
jgi:hypothetical protein